MDGGGWERAHELEAEVKTLHTQLRNATLIADRLLRDRDALRDAVVMVCDLLRAGQHENAQKYIDGFLAGIIERENRES